MGFLQKVGLFIFSWALLLFGLLLTFSQHRVTDEVIERTVTKEYHLKAMKSGFRDQHFLDERFTNSFAFVPQLKAALKVAQTQLESEAQIVNWKATTIPEGVAEWDFRMSDGDLKHYLFQLTKASSKGMVVQQKGLFFLLTIGMGILGALLYLWPGFSTIPGIKHQGIFTHPLTRGLKGFWRGFFLVVTMAAIFATGYIQMGWLSWFTGLLAVIMLLLSVWPEKLEGKGKVRSASPRSNGWLGILTGLFLIGFYVLLYWFPEYITNWVLLVDPISRALSGHAASQWFLYGFLYTVVMWVMGIRMIAKYRHNRYQLVRTGSVIFFQTGFAFLIPEILVRLNQPYFDFKNIWPLDYDFFFDWNINSLVQSGHLGIFMLVWGIVLFVIGVPVLTYFWGKRWYCSWVCGCGGLAETLGDPFRQLSDKSLRAWRIERYLVHGVLVFSVVMTGLVLYTYFSGQSQVLGLDSYQVRSWYGFLIGSAFAGVVGTGFYPLMGNRVWCRFGCPLAAYLGLVQRFKSRFRITTNGGQCISCGNCSTYCEMGIDVRWYAQRGQDVVRSSCVGCGVCAAVCPRGVLRLENSAGDLSDRGQIERVLQIDSSGVRWEP